MKMTVQSPKKTSTNQPMLRPSRIMVAPPAVNATPTASSRRLLVRLGRSRSVSGASVVIVGAAYQAVADEDTSGLGDAS